MFVEVYPQQSEFSEECLAAMVASALNKQVRALPSDSEESVLLEVVGGTAKEDFPKIVKLGFDARIP